MSIWDVIETIFFAALTVSAFRQTMGRYDLKIGEKELDLLQVMMQNKEGTDALCKTGILDITERTLLIINTKTLTLFFEGIAEDQYLELIEFMVNQVNLFLSHGSGWINNRTEKLLVIFAVFSSISAGV